MTAIIALTRTELKLLSRERVRAALRKAEEEINPNASRVTLTDAIDQLPPVDGGRWS